MPFYGIYFATSRLPRWGNDNSYIGFAAIILIRRACPVESFIIHTMVLQILF
jgi:hypothetical protein